MDPLSIKLSAALARLLPSLLHIGDAASQASAENAGEQLGETALKRIYDVWRKVWPNIHGRKATDSALNEIVNNPGSGHGVSMLAEAIEEALRGQGDLRKEVLLALQQIPGDWAVGGTASITQQGRYNTVFQGPATGVRIGDDHEINHVFHRGSDDSQTKLNDSQTTDNIINVLFVAADPTDASRLRLGEEFRNIQQMLQIAKHRDRYSLCLRMSTRVPDLTQAILDEAPRIVHFAGHGRNDGGLCLEDVNGQVHPVSPDAIAQLFRAAGGVECVVLNACFSVTQPRSIAEHVPYVIGMDKQIGDQAAIAFTHGFYQALGAGRSVPDAFTFGRTQLSLLNIAEDLTPQLIVRPVNETTPTRRGTL